MRLLTGLFVALVVTSSALAQGEPKDPEEAITISLEGMDLDRVVKLVSDELQIRILYDEKILKRKVNLVSPIAVKRKDLLAVLLSILEMQNFTMVKAGPPEAIVWKVVPFTAPIADPSKKGKLPVISTDDLGQLPNGEELSTLVVTLKQVGAREAFIAVQGMASDPRMVQAIEPARILVVTDTAPNVRRIAEILKLMDRPVPVEGRASIAIETCLFDVSVASLASRGIRMTGSREGKSLDQVDAGALWSDLVAAAGSPEVRLLHRYSGHLLEGIPMRTKASAKSFSVRLSIVPTLPKVPAAAVPGQPAPEDAPGPADGEVALSVDLDVSYGDEARSEDQTTLAGKEGTWLLWAIQSAAQDGTVRLFFARAGR